MTDQAELIARVRRGDSQAFNSLVQPHLPRAYRTAYLITHDPHSASDALQEGLWRAYRSIGNLRPGTPFYPWFARVVVNEALKQAAQLRRIAYAPIPDLPEFETPESALLDQEEREHLWQAVQQLSPDHRAVIVLRYYEEMIEADMAIALGVSPGTVKSRLNRARQALQQALQPPEARRPFFRLFQRLSGGTPHE